MAGLYVHIPFCRQACHYCDFHFSTTLHRVPEMVEGLKQELRLRRDAWSTRTFQTLYFGGGTPSMLTTAQLDELFEALHSEYNINPDAEWTLEANPDDLTMTRLQYLSESPINRLSIGIQAFDDTWLSMMNRSHDSAQAIRVISEARSFGFRDLTADLIYGMPQMNLNQWKEQVKRLLDFELPHFSSYALTVEPRTALAHQVEKGTVQMPEDGLVEDQFHALVQAAESAGYEHYEVSNFARPGHRSKHNTSYWHGVPYLGIGPSAHSYDGKMRRWNVANNAHYLEALEEGGTFHEQEELSEADRYNEWVMTGLRLSDGIRREGISEFSSALRAHFDQEVSAAQAAGELVEEDGYIRIAPWRRFRSDGIASDLFYIQDD
ncbi:radical SAM family heme chaperone HemW [Cryomorphaceae bacterium]|nr:radical SAM family heme chaperone HemW [Cryomorphaceae bacterium]